MKKFETVKEISSEVEKIATYIGWKVVREEDGNILLLLEDKPFIYMVMYCMKQNMTEKEKIEVVNRIQSGHKRSEKDGYPVTIYTDGNVYIYFFTKSKKNGDLDFLLAPECFTDKEIRKKFFNDFEI